MEKIYRNYKSKSKKLFALTICLDLAILLIVGVTLAYVFTTSGEVKNTFTPPKPDTTVEEKFDGKIKENVKIKVGNESNAGVKSYIRAEVVVTWQEQTAGEDNIFSIIPAETTDYTIEYNLNNTSETAGQWFLGTDGFYYFTEPVEPGKETTVLIKQAIQKAPAPAGYYLHIEILGQSIQAEPVEAATSVWGVTISGTTVTGPKATAQSE